MDTNIENDNIDVESIMRKIRENVRKRKENNTYPRIDGHINELQQVACDELDENLRKNLDYISSNYEIYNEYSISSHRKIFGNMLVSGRKLVHGEVRRYVDPIIGKQSELNSYISRTLDIFAKENVKINNSIDSINKDIDTKINNSIDSINKDIDTKINNSIDSINKDANVKIGKSSKWREFYKDDVTEDFLKGNVIYHDYFISLINRYARKFSQNDIPKIAEVGIGTATMSIHFSKTSYEVLGIDNDPLIVSKAMDTNNRLGGYAKFICLDAFDLQKYFKDKIFDVVFSQGTMEHFDNDNLKRIIETQLYIGRYIIFSVPSINYPNSEFGNERKMSTNEWESLIKSFGYTVEHISYYQEGDQHVAGVISP